MKNKLTVAICVYNCEKYVATTLKCILNQTYQAFDLLIVNDCSTDSSKSVIEEFFALNPRQYTLVEFDQNKGLAEGRHYVETTVQTKYLLFVDADDCPKPKLVETLFKKISSDSDLMAVGCYHHFINGEGARINGGIYLGAKSKEAFYLKAEAKKLIFMQPTAIIDRDCLLAAGGRNINGFAQGKPRYQDLCEDLDLWTRMSDFYVSGKAIVVIPEVLCYYRKHQTGISNNSLGMILRMRHIKTNLLRRRAVEPELTFQEFYSQLSEKDLKGYQKNAIAADSLKNGVFLLKEGKLLRSAFLIIKSFLTDPKYFLQKIKSNSGIIK